MQRRLEPEAGAQANQQSEIASPRHAGVLERAGDISKRSSALEPAMARRWDEQLAAYVPASVKTQNLATWTHEAINLTGNLVGAAALWYGAHLVMQNDANRAGLTVGQFVAFNMFAQRIAQPVMRMAQRWTDFQQVGISVARLGDILNTRTKIPPSSVAQLPPVQGRITLNQVVFRYRPDAAPVLNGLTSSPP